MYLYLGVELYFYCFQRQGKDAHAGAVPDMVPHRTQRSWFLILPPATQIFRPVELLRNPEFVKV